MWLQSLGQEHPLEEGMATHSNIFAWRIPRTEEPGRLQSIGSQSQTRLKQLNMHTIRTLGCCFFFFFKTWNVSLNYFTQKKIKSNLQIQNHNFLCLTISNKGTYFWSISVCLDIFFSGRITKDIIECLTSLMHLRLYDNECFVSLPTLYGL